MLDMGHGTPAPSPVTPSPGGSPSAGAYAYLSRPPCTPEVTTTPEKPGTFLDAVHDAEQYGVLLLKSKEGGGLSPRALANRLTGAEEELFGIELKTDPAGLSRSDFYFDPKRGIVDKTTGTVEWEAHYALRTGPERLGTLTDALRDLEDAGGRNVVSPGNRTRGWTWEDPDELIKVIEATHKSAAPNAPFEATYFCRRETGEVVRRIGREDTVVYVATAGLDARPAPSAASDRCPSAPASTVHTLRVGTSVVAEIPVRFGADKSGFALVMANYHVAKSVARAAYDWITPGEGVPRDAPAFEQGLTQFRKSAASELADVDNRIEEIQKIVHAQGVTVVAGEFDPVPDRLRRLRKFEDRVVAGLTEHGVSNPQAVDDLLKLTMGPVHYLMLKGKLDDVSIAALEDTALADRQEGAMRREADLKKRLNDLQPGSAKGLRAEAEPYIDAGEPIPKVEADALLTRFTDPTVREAARAYLDAIRGTDLLVEQRSEKFAENALRAGAVSADQSPVVLIVAGAAHFEGVIQALQRRGGAP